MWDHHRLGGMLQSVLDGDQGRQHGPSVGPHREDESESVPLHQRIQFGCVMVGVQQSNCPPHESSPDVVFGNLHRAPTDLRCVRCPTASSLSGSMLESCDAEKAGYTALLDGCYLELDGPTWKKRRRKGRRSGAERGRHSGVITVIVSA